MKYKGLTVNKSTRRIVAQQCVAGRLVFIASLPMPYEWGDYTGDKEKDQDIFAHSSLGDNKHRLPPVLNEALFDERSEQLARIRDEALFFWMQEEGEVTPSKLNFPEDFLNPDSLPKPSQIAVKFLEKAKGLSMLSGRSNVARTLRDLQERVRFLENHLFAKKKSQPSTPGAYLGTCFFRGKWLARITVRGKSHHLGTFDTERDAALAYDAAKIKHDAPGPLNFPLPESTESPRFALPEIQSPIFFENEQWHAQIQLGSGWLPVGDFDTRAEAVEAYNGFARENGKEEIQ